MLRISPKDYAEIRRHGEETYPHECCGVLLGQMDGDLRKVTSTARCGNTRTDSPQNRYNIDPKELVRVQRQARERNEDIIGFYHSHPDHPAEWSPTDLAEAHWIGCSYVITRVAGGKADVTNSFELTGSDEAEKAFVGEKVEVDDHSNWNHAYGPHFNTDKKFLKTLEDWLGSHSEIMVLIQYSRAAGNKSFEFFTSFAALSERLHPLQAETRITALRRPQLPLRGVVDDAFIDQCLRNIQDGSEFVVVETVRRTAGRYSWFHDEAGETHEELRESLEAARGSAVAVGEYPPWLEDNPEVISGYVPDEDGVVRTGVY